MRLHRLDNKNVHPVKCLLIYRNRTARLTDNSDPVFVSLKHPFRHVDSSTMSRVLNESIRQAGLSPQFNARFFRPPGATTAMQSSADVGEVRQLGRWKSRGDVFYRHYVYPNSKTYITSSVLNSQLTLYMFSHQIFFFNFFLFYFKIISL